MNHLHGQYNGLVVLLSFLIAVAASYSSLGLACKISRARGRNRTVWLAAGSCVMGAGIWSMHFIGTLAFHVEAEVRYNVFFTLLSLIAGIISSYIAFRATAASDTSVDSFLVAGLFMGGGIVAMHYIGMSAISEPISIAYDPVFVALSIVVSLTASYVSLILFRKFRVMEGYNKWKLLSAVIMALGICGMHFTGMRAAQFILDSTHRQEGFVAPQSLLLTGIAIAIFIVLAITLGAMFFDRNVLERMAYSDALTGMPNRNQLARYFDESFTGQEGGFLLFIDLDRFKTINDTLGHDAGDLFIKEVAQRLKHAIAGDQTVFRLGGDEFLVVSSSGRKWEATALAGKLVSVIKRPFSVLGNEIYMTTSIGISLAPQHGHSRTALLKAADVAMYRAKSAGKNQYQLFDEETDRIHVRKLELERDLRKAMANKELRIYYQPEWDAELNCITGMEALLRWKHPRLGMVSPAEFIPIAEETGLIVSITRWVLFEVCMQNRDWQRRDIVHVCISVNMSIRVFESGMLCDMVEEALLESKINPGNLELEITESIAMYDVQDTIRQLQYLKVLGVRVSMDDFGTGYSSLGNLDEIPIDALKIDQKFIRQSAQPSKQAIISTIIAIATHLKLEVVAEGVETEEQIGFLQSRGCRVMQGYYYGRPMDAEALENWLLAKNGSGEGEKWSG